MALKRLLFVLALVLVPALAAAQTGTYPTTATSSGGGGTVTQGTAAATTDAAAWPVKVVFGSAQIDPRDVSDRAARLLGKVTFDGAQAVTQSGAWTFSLSNFPTTASTSAVSVRCVNAAGSAFESCAGSGGAGGGGDGAILDGVDPAVKATVTAAHALTVDGSAVTQPVSGTFWQTTQPVSGTFWQATQPVSLASVPSHAVTNAGTFAVQVTSAPTTAVTGTFWQGTQPVSGPLTDTQLRASAVPVSGTFWQATQPVSGTVTANAGTGTFAINQTQINGVAVSVNNGVSDTGTQRAVLAQEATYAAGLTVKTNTAAGTNPFFSLCGSATKTVRVQRFSVSGTVATAAVWGDVVLKKTSTATSGGTATTLTAGAYDSTSAAATAVAKYYTVLATTPGTMVNVVLALTQLFPVTAISTTLQPTPAPIVYLWRDQDAEAPTLRGTGECLTANFGTTTTNAPTLTVSVAWTEK